MARKKPLRRLKATDVRWSRRDNTRVVAAPLWAYESWGRSCIRIESAWASIYAIRKRRIKEREKRTRRDGASRKRYGPPWAPYGRGSQLRFCEVCGSKFFGQGRIVACTDACAKIQRKKTHVNSKRVRRVEHQPINCKQCGVEFMPRRKDAIFCGVQCRVKNHREGEKK
jgi:hypothetical protein